MENEESLRVDALTVGPFQSNCYLVRRPPSEGMVIIDPGAEPDRIQSAIRERERDPSLILCTHGHLDHIGAVANLKETYDIPAWIHRGDRDWVDNIQEQARMFGLSSIREPSFEAYLEEGQNIRKGGCEMDVIHTPGHSRGGVTFLEQEAAFVGDCVFSGSIGRTDLPGGNKNVLLETIEEKIMSLPDRTKLYPGHGPSTRVKQERESNPFLGGE